MIISLCNETLHSDFLINFLGINSYIYVKKDNIKTAKQRTKNGLIKIIY